MGIQVLLFVGLGGALGSVLRALISHFLSSQTIWATVLANLGGAILIGFLSKWAATFGTGEIFRAFWIIGLCGGFTTFSTFGMDLFSLLQRGDWGIGFVYVCANFFGTLFFIWLGFKMANLTLL